VWHALDDDDAPLLVRVVVLLMDSSLELELELNFTPSSTHSPRKTRGSSLGFFSFFYFFFFLSFLSIFWEKLDGKIFNPFP